MSNQKKYWNSVQHLEGNTEFIDEANKEFPEHVPVQDFLGDENLGDATTSRRDFLKFLGFSVSAATLAACETPVTKAIPYVNKPNEITPGVANYYASTYYDGNDYASILVKNRDGRPIFIQGNNEAKFGSSINVRVNTSVLDLYDSNRLQAPLKAGKETTWKTVDNEVTQKLKNTVGSGKKVVLLTNSIISPSTKKLIKELTDIYENAANTIPGGTFQHVPFDAISYSGLLNANEKTFGKRVVPAYEFSKAKTVVSIGADFLSDWLMSSTYAKDYGLARNPEGEWMTKHYQVETRLSLTGSNADVRIPVKPSEQAKVAVLLYNEIAKKAGAPALKASPVEGVNVSKMAADLWANKGASLVVCGSNSEYTQIIVNKTNELLGNYGKTIDTDKYSEIKSGKDADVLNLIKEMNDGSVGAVIVSGVDPIYSLATDLKFADAYAKVPVKVSVAQRLDFTAELSDYVCPMNHYLESWNDATPAVGYASLAQPVISPIYNTRTLQDALMQWAGVEGDYYTYIQNNWKSSFTSNFTKQWNTFVHDGVTVTGEKPEASVVSMNDADVAAAGQAIFNVKAKGIELELYTKIAIGDGSRASNPWLQELPDPISKVVWDNYIAMNPTDMKAEGYDFETNIQQQIPASVAKVSVNGKEITLPVFPSPGQKLGTIGIALGYGKAIVQDELVGKNASHFMSTDANGDMVNYVTGVTIEALGEDYPIASSQTHHTIMDVDPADPEKGRKIVNETTLSGFKKGREHYNPQILLTDAYGEKKTTFELDLWEPHNYDTFGHRWGMAIDLSTCIGCNACVTACHSENNVPVVGKDEVRRNRDMFWLRIDRYYSSDMNENVAQEEGIGAVEMYKKMESASTYPQVVHQPVMCQHCNHAPCETVCPASATTHSNEGLNQMTYNRCVGTRYCANNCPYKVRRFNWFQYDAYDKFTGVNPAQHEVERMVLNPDVTVRSRGVMEKCSMCVQRIQAGKLEAKKNKEKVQDGAIQMACQTACPTNAITFGDLNDTASQVRETFTHDRAYLLLEEVGTQPNVKYLTKVRNITESEA